MFFFYNGENIKYLIINENNKTAGTQLSYFFNSFIDNYAEFYNEDKRYSIIAKEDFEMTEKILSIFTSLTLNFRRNYWFSLDIIYLVPNMIPLTC